MHDEPRLTTAGHSVGPQVRELFERLNALVFDGLKHGFFEYSIACETTNEKLQIVIRGGKSHKFTIPKRELLR